MKKKIFQAGACIFGEGRPKICIPIVEVSREAIWEKAEQTSVLPADIIEWRADFYEHVLEPEAVSAVLKGLKERLGKRALLFTFRTKGEGGNCAVSIDTYDALNETAAKAGADLVDVELYLDEKNAGERIRKLSSFGCRVIVSSHDFQKTPAVEEMVRRLQQMEQLGADAAKLAVMPKSRQDVLNLLQASITADDLLSVPVVTMSMGVQGVLSRLGGCLTGSAMTFASAGKTSAPGQIPVEQMACILEVL